MKDQTQLPYVELEGEIPTSICQDEFISINRSTPLKIYQLGFQPAKSIPEIPRWFLHKYIKPSSMILEPFAGSGTTIIEALKGDHQIAWLDYHPLSRLICRVKTTEFIIGDVRQEISRILKLSRPPQNAPKTIDFSNKDFWFQKTVQEGLEILKEHISQAPDDIQPVLWLIFSLTVRKSSDMNEGMILAAKRSCVQEIPVRSREDVFNYFEGYANKAIVALEEWGMVINGCRNKARELPIYDARIITTPYKFDAIMTSPPYINAIDYVWASKFELHWLGLVKNDSERLALYEKEIGTERIPSQEVKELGQIGNSYLDSLIEEIYTGRKYKASKGQNALRSRVTYRYFADMREHFRYCFDLLKAGGYYCFTIGDRSNICGVEIPVAEILTDLACELGFKREFHFHLLLKNRKLNIPRNVTWAGTIKHDTTIVLRKPVV